MHSNKRARETHDPVTVSYPNGSGLVIRYPFINGTHFASKISHFQDIAQCISTMHDAGIVHGDIRGFNMLHPHPEPVPGGMTKSCLIDLDLCGHQKTRTAILQAMQILCLTIVFLDLAGRIILWTRSTIGKILVRQCHCTKCPAGGTRRSPIYGKNFVSICIRKAWSILLPLMSLLRATATFQLN
jgi:hypothetical protein